MVGATRGIVQEFGDDWKASIPKEMTFKRSEFQRWRVSNDARVIDACFSCQVATKLVIV